MEVKATTDSIQKTGTVNVLVSKIPVEFTKAQGKIDIIWVNKANQKIEKPIAPVLNGMKKVYWKDGEEIKEENGTFTESEWYSYEAGDNKTDSKTSKWANAIDTVDNVESYFVWIPRYAYRMIYTTADGNVAGYCDGEGIREITGEKVEEPKKGIETVEYNGYQYIIHPAFETNIDYGGWDEDLSGIWVGKYETSKNPTNTKAQVVPEVESWRNETIGSFYTKAFEYDRSKESHLMKNSEWGACAYLTYSQYGRNNHEVSINTSSSYITGSGNEFEDSKFASSTGNEYGVYDLCGGAYEYVAAFNDIGSLNYGSIFAGTEKDSTKYATKYSSKSTSPSYESYYPGDATYEVYVGSNKAWNGDHTEFAYSSNPFFVRGGGILSGSGAGVFYSDDTYAGKYNTYSFRLAVRGV